MLPNSKLAIFGISSLTLNDDEKYLLKNAAPWGIILFARNVEDREQLINLTQEIKSYDPNINILIDEEGGRVTRLKNIYPDILPSAESLGLIYQENKEAGKSAITQAYSEMAKRLKALGINIVCAPVADLAHQNTHGVIGDRAFGNKVDLVVDTAKIAADTLLANGVTPIIKHLPGHGRATCDSHLELPTITDSLAELEKNDFAIFKALNHYPLAMTAHIIYECLDKDLPITLSKQAFRYLREQIGFKGKIMSDDINMRALKKFTLAEIVTYAINAGCDYILHCDGNYAEMSNIVEELNRLDAA